MKQFFAPISKINKDTWEVSGILALEQVDKEGEIMDYEASKPFFEQWSNGIRKASGGKSVGNLRVMHQPTIGGKFTEISFNDDLKQIEVVAKVSNADARRMIEEGELNGFSIYGDYAWRKKDTALKARRYAVKPVEGSLVDNPCMYGAEFTEINKNGQITVRKFAGNKEPEQVWICKKPNCDLYHKSQENAVECTGVVEKSFDEELEDDFTNTPEPVSKSMYDVSSLASSISNLQYLTVPDEIKPKYAKAVKNLFSVLTSMAKVEQSKFVSSLTLLTDAANAVKSVGMEILEGEDKMATKIKVADIEDIDEFESELVDRVAKSAGLTKAVSKKVAASIAPLLEEMVENAMGDVYKTVNQVVKTVNAFGASPKKTTVVSKSADRGRRKDEDDEEVETPKKIAELKPTADREDPELLKAMKAALKKPISQVDDNEPDDDEDDNEEGNEE